MPRSAATTQLATDGICAHLAVLVQAAARMKWSMPMVRFGFAMWMEKRP